jgi:hypothetical protein
MNGTGRFGAARNWLYAYWGAFALVLAVLAHALWQRGVGATLRQRLRLLPIRLRGRAALLAGAGAIAWIALGGWVFYNTNILNEYVTTPQREEQLAEREKALIGFENVPQPRVVDVRLMSSFPGAVRAAARGNYLIENRSGRPLAEVHLQWPDD